MNTDLYMSEQFSDITLVVENVRIPAHKIILAAQSSYFRSLFSGGFAETAQHEIELRRVPLEAFKVILKYIYTGRLSLDNCEVDQLIDVLGLADLYDFETLISPISMCLPSKLSLNNCCAILNAANLYSLDTLNTYCITFMDRNAGDLLNHETFMTLSQRALCSLLERDSFFVPEVDIAKAVRDWHENNPNDSIEVSFIQYLVEHFCVHFKIRMLGGAFLDTLATYWYGRIIEYRSLNQNFGLTKSFGFHRRKS